MLNFKGSLKIPKSNDRLFMGVFGGFAEHFGWSKTWTRVIGTVLIMASHGFLFLVYLLLGWLMPDKTNRDENINLFDLFNSFTSSSEDTMKKKPRKNITDAEEHDVK